MSVLATRRTYKPADERREQILDCALRVFSEKGYHGASIADVCARAGIGRATLYQYFTDKRDVLLALADRIARRVTDAVAARPRLVLNTAPSEEQAVRFVERRFFDILSVVFEDAATARLILRAGRGADGVVDAMLDQIEAAVLDVAVADLDESQRAGVVRPLDSRLVARFFLGGIEKIVLADLDADRPVDLAHLAREAALLEICGVYARKTEPAAAGTTAPSSSPKPSRKPSRKHRKKQGDRR